MSDISFILEEMAWSFSRLSEYNNCPRAFWLTYIEKKDGIDNAFGQYGSFIHKLIEEQLKGNLMIFELLPKFEEEFTSKVTEYFPPLKDNASMAEKYFEYGKKYFENYNGFENYEILDIEKKYQFKIGKYNSVGIIDLEVRNKNNELEIIDHKTKGKSDYKRLSKKLKESGYITLVDKRYVPFDLFIQQYLYCIPFKEKYGEYPKYLNLNMIRINDWYKIEFNKDEFKKSVEFCIKSIDNIYEEKDFKEKVDQFYCDYLCSQNINCKYSKRYLPGIEDYIEEN